MQKKLQEGASKNNPISALYEVAQKLNWGAPNFVQSFTGGPPQARTFIFKCKFKTSAAENAEKEFQPTVAVTTKKAAKAAAAQFVLRELGLLPKDPNNPL